MRRELAGWLPRLWVLYFSPIAVPVLLLPSTPTTHSFHIKAHASAILIFPCLLLHTTVPFALRWTTTSPPGSTAPATARSARRTSPWRPWRRPSPASTGSCASSRWGVGWEGESSVVLVAPESFFFYLPVDFNLSVGPRPPLIPRYVSLPSSFPEERFEFRVVLPALPTPPTAVLSISQDRSAVVKIDNFIVGVFSTREQSHLYLFDHHRAELPFHC